MDQDLDALGDEDLCRAAAAGEEWAFRRLVLRHQDGVLRMAAQLLGDQRAHAEDAAQEVFLAVHRALPRFRFESSFKTWLYSLTRHVVLGRRRSLLRSIAGRWRSLWSGEEGAMLDFPDGSPPLIEALEKQEQEARLRTALSRLSETARTALLLRDAEGLTYEEMAVVLDVPVGTVRSRLHNATARLVALFQEDEDEG